MTKSKLRDLSTDFAVKVLNLTKKGAHKTGRTLLPFVALLSSLLLVLSGCISVPVYKNHTPTMTLPLFRSTICGKATRTMVAFMKNRSPSTPYRRSSLTTFSLIFLTSVFPTASSFSPLLQLTPPSSSATGWSVSTTRTDPLTLSPVTTTTNSMMKTETAPTEITSAATTNCGTL